MSAKPNELTTIEMPRNTVTPMEMIGNALATGVSSDVLEKLMALQERWDRNVGRRAFDEAMAAAKAEMPVIFKNREVDFTSQKGRTHYRHEDLGEITRTVTPILARHGLSYRFRTAQDGPQVTVTCIVSHRDGHSEENTLSAGRDDSGNKNSIQAIGSAITYLQRYTLKAALGLAASDDDDGEASGAGETVSEEQAKNIRAIADKLGADIPLFCQYLGVDAITSLPAKRYDDAIRALNAKQRQARS